MKKLFAILVALMMLFTVPMALAENLSGGWTAAESPAVTEDVTAALNAATEGLVGCSYEAVALLGSQIVAGTNYCILCKLTPVVPDAVPHYALVYVWQKLDGGAELLAVEDIELAVPEQE